MEFHRIDMGSWARREHFAHFYEKLPCTYSMTTKLDITALAACNARLYPALLYGVATIVNRHEEFRMNVDENGHVGFFSETLPCYTVFHKDTETFSDIWTEYSGDYSEFCRRYEKDIQRYGGNKGMAAKPNPPVNTFSVSMIPWASFEGFNLNLEKGYEYLLPIFTFGRYHDENGKRCIPLAVQVHHAACDGFHVCRFINELQELIHGMPCLAESQINGG